MGKAIGGFVTAVLFCLGLFCLAALALYYGSPR